MSNLENDVKNTIQYLSDRNKVEGFSLEPYAYVKNKFSEEDNASLVVKDVHAEGVEILFRLKNPNGKVIAKTIKAIPILDADGNDTGKVSYCLAEAFVYLDYKDPEEHFVVREIASSVYEEAHPEINVEVSAHTNAKLKALKKLGYGAEYGFESKYYHNNQQEDNVFQPTTVMSQEDDAYQQTLLDLDPEFRKFLDTNEQVKEDHAENDLDKAFHVVCHADGMEGLTLGEIYNKLPRYLEYMTTSDTFKKDKNNKEAYEAALFILEHTK